MLEAAAVGKRLASARSERGLSQSDLAHLLSVSLRSVQKYEHGERDLPSQAIVALYRAWNISPLWLLLGQDPADALSGDKVVEMVCAVYECFEKPLEDERVPFVVRKPFFRALVREAIGSGSVDRGKIDAAVKDILD